MATFCSSGEFSLEIRVHYLIFVVKVKLKLNQLRIIRFPIIGWLRTSVSYTLYNCYMAVGMFEVK